MSVRNIPHIEGNYATFAFVGLVDSSKTIGRLQQELLKAYFKSDLYQRSKIQLELIPSQSLHLSLSKCVYLNRHQISQLQTLLLQESTPHPLSPPPPPPPLLYSQHLRDRRHLRPAPATFQVTRATQGIFFAPRQEGLAIFPGHCPSFLFAQSPLSFQNNSRGPVLSTSARATQISVVPTLWGNCCLIL